MRASSRGSSGCHCPQRSHLQSCVSCGRRIPCRGCWHFLGNHSHQDGHFLLVLPRYRLLLTAPQVEQGGARLDLKCYRRSEGRNRGARFALTGRVGTDHWQHSRMNKYGKRGRRGGEAKRAFFEIGCSKAPSIPLLLTPPLLCLLGTHVGARPRLQPSNNVGVTEPLRLRRNDEKTKIVSHGGFEVGGNRPVEYANKPCHSFCRSPLLGIAYHRSVAERVEEQSFSKAQSLISTCFDFSADRSCSALGL